MPRPYTKRATEYWENRRNTPVAAAPAQPITIHTSSEKPPVKAVPMPDIIYGSTEVMTNEARANCYGESPTSTRNRQINAPVVDAGAFQNLEALPAPFYNFNGNRDYSGMGNTINLCAKAWANVAIFRNAIEACVEFSNQPLYIKSDNETVEKFFNEWFGALNMNDLKEQFFREYYRSGNVFLYKFNGKFGPAYYQNLQQSFAAKENKIPIRYDLLNPMNIYVPNGLTYPYTYVQLLSTYEIARLRNPITEQDRQVYNSLPTITKTQIKTAGAFPQGVFIPIDPNRLRYAFYKKQSYEPLAVPMGWPVLPDIEWKLTLKKMDMALSRTVEQAILLVTTGETGTEWNGGNGINQNNIARLQALFNNQTLSRVLVSDFTTKAEWKIPQLKDVLGPEKYKIVNEDIAEGLQTIFVGKEDKFASAQLKAKIFIQRLEEGQNVFLNNFLLPEINMVCDAFGFRTKPIVKFQKINLQDEAVMARIVAQLAQLGILTAEQTVEAMETGVLPDAYEMRTGQDQYKKDRDAGKYFPLVGGSQKDGGGQIGGGGRPDGTKGIKQTTKKISPQGTSQASEKLNVSTKELVTNTLAAEELREAVGGAVKKRFKVRTLNDNQKNIVDSFAKIIMATQPRSSWKKSVAETIEKPVRIPDQVAREIDEISIEHSVDSWNATLIWNSRTSASSLSDEV
jgi:hypothetical protein